MTPKEVLTNSTFCPVPWTGLMYNGFDGTVKNCIRSAGTIGNIKDTPIEQIVQGNTNILIQNKIVSDVAVPTCHTCYNLENGKKGFDVISDRKFYIRELKNVSLDTYRAGNFDLKTVDVRWTNTCNFACVYCNPEFSSRWAAELDVKQPSPTDEQRANLKRYILERADQLEHVYLAGGEPLLMRENLELLDLLDPEVNLRINTNLSKVDTQVFERICKFRNVHWTVSVETVGDEFEYIRYGGSWQDFQDNLKYIQTLDHKITFNMLHFLLNFKSLFGCVDFLKAQGFHNNAFVIGALLEPEYLNIRHLPDSVLQSVKSILEQRINEQPGYLLEDGYRNMLHYIEQPFEKDLLGSMNEIHILDQRRKVNSSKIFKELYSIL